MKTLFPMARPAFRDASVAQAPVSRPVLPAPVRHVEPVVVSRSLFSFPQMFLFFGPWNAEPPRVIPVEPDLTPRRGLDRMHAEPENRATDMMRTILRRMDL